MKGKRVVVTGYGLASPIGNNPEVFLNNLMNSYSGIKFSEELLNAGTKCCVAGIPDISSEEQSLIENYNASRFSTSIHYSLIALINACKMAGISVSNSYSTPLNDSLGIIMGSLAGNSDMYLSFLTNFLLPKKIHKLRTSIAETMMNSSVSTFVSGITGASSCVLSTSNACASGTEAIVLGFERLKWGIGKQMIVGGYESSGVVSWSLYDSMRVLGSDSNEHPERSSRPMNESVSGFIPAAGAGILILEEMEHAVARGATIFAEIIGGSINSGAQRNGGTMSAPNCDATVKCIQNAVTEAEIDAEKIDYLCGHLTSTMADVLEIQNWSKALKRNGADFPLINTIKGMTGHCVGAAGSIETIAAIMQMNTGTIHPNVNCEPIHPEILKIIDKNCIPLRPVKKNINYCAKLSLGFGDVNACIVLKNINT